MNNINLEDVKKGTGDPKNWVKAVGYGVGTVAFAYIMMSSILRLIVRQFEIEFSGLLLSVLAPAIEFGMVLVFTLLMVYLLDISDYIYWPELKRSHIKSIAGLTVGMLLIQMIGGLLIALLGIEPAQNAVIEQGEQNPMFYLYMIPVMILFVGPVEELIFRGVIQGAFRRHLNTGIAIILVSILFGLAHVPAVGGLSLEAIPYIVMASFLGGVIGFVYEYTEDITVPALAHGIYNSFLMLFVYIGVTQDITEDVLFILF